MRLTRTFVKVLDEAITKRGLGSVEAAAVIGVHVATLRNIVNLDQLHVHSATATKLRTFVGAKSIKATATATNLFAADTVDVNGVKFVKLASVQTLVADTLNALGV